MCQGWWSNEIKILDVHIIGVLKKETVSRIFFYFPQEWATFVEAKWIGQIFPGVGETASSVNGNRSFLHTHTHTKKNRNTSVKPHFRFAL